jgi:hypothetical protein
LERHGTRKHRVALDSEALLLHERLLGPYEEKVPPKIPKAGPFSDFTLEQEVDAIERSLIEDFLPQYVAPAQSVSLKATQEEAFEASIVTQHEEEPDLSQINGETLDESNLAAPSLVEPTLILPETDRNSSVPPKSYTIEETTSSTQSNNPALHVESSRTQAEIETLSPATNSVVATEEGLTATLKPLCDSIAALSSQIAKVGNSVTAVPMLRGLQQLLSIHKPSS